MPEWLIQILNLAYPALIVAAATAIVRLYFKVNRMAEDLAAMRETDLAAIAEQLSEVRKESADLHEWHDVHDEDGVHTWKIRTSLTRAINGVATSQIAIANALEGFRSIREREADATEAILGRLERLEARRP